VYGGGGADTINAQTAVRFGEAREEIFGGDQDDTVAAADGVQDVIDCGSGLDTVVSYDAGLDELTNCETAMPAATPVGAN
jgi:hypothetical protein